jgi:predicted Zn-ribbon and HTH transcriptional regulator
VIREDRDLLAFGPATAYRLTLIAKQGPVTTAGYLTGTVNFLRAHIGWITTEPTFGLEDFSGHVYASVRALRRFDQTNQPTGTVIACPTVSERGECGYRLRYEDLGDHVTCPRCKATRDAATLATIAMSDGRQVWLDPEAAAKHLGIDERTLRRRALRGELQRSHGRYLISTA